MSREIRRVPLDFTWPLNKVWEGYLTPEQFREEKCPDCRNGYSARAQNLFDLWYGYVPFRPEDNGSVPLTPSTPVVREFAERNVSRSPEYYGVGETAVAREAQRLCGLWNGMWSHHIADVDVSALVEAGRLTDFTHTWTRETGWQKIDPPVVPTAEQVNEWSIRGFGHDALNASVVVRARCEREGVDDTCGTCQGHSTLEAYEGQRAEGEVWAEQDHEPPKGEGWQLWETVSEGSPVSPVFATAEELAQWLTTPDGGKAAGPSKRPMTIEQARGFVDAGWAPSFISNAGGLHDGAAYVGTERALGDLE